MGIEPGDHFGSRVVLKVGRNRIRQRVVRLRCLVCGVRTDCHGKDPGRNCQLCIRNKRRPERRRAHL